MIEVVLGTALYTLIATRTAIVLLRYREKYHEGDKQIVTTLFLSAIWPFTAFTFGFITIMSGIGLATEEDSSLSRPQHSAPETK